MTTHAKRFGGHFEGVELPADVTARTGFLGTPRAVLPIGVIFVLTIMAAAFRAYAG